MLSQINVWHVGNSFDYGGTERAMANWCLEIDRRYFAPRALSRGAGGGRLADLREAGVPAEVIGPDRTAWQDLFRGGACHVLHVHRHGEHDPGWNVVLQEARAAGVPVLVETNVFGARDDGEGRDAFDLRGFVSAMCLWRYAAWPATLPPGYLDRHAVFYNPLRVEEFPERMPDPEEKRSARKALGIPRDRFLVGRIGRPDIHKWPSWLLGAFESFHRRFPDSALILMEAPPEILADVERRGLREVVCPLEASADWERVQQVYTALDVLAHGSRVGESFGYTLAEAGASWLPVVVDSTPWADNAQVELVEHGVNGMIAGRPSAYVNALLALALAPERRRLMGERGRSNALRRFDARALARSLEARYLGILREKGPALSEEVKAYHRTLVETPTRRWIEGFGREYRRRLKERHGSSAFLDGLWAARSSLRLHGRRWAGRGLRALGLRRDRAGHPPAPAR